MPAVVPGGKGVRTAVPPGPPKAADMICWDLKRVGFCKNSRWCKYVHDLSGLLPEERPGGVDAPLLETDPKAVPKQVAPRIQADGGPVQTPAPLHSDPDEAAKRAKRAARFAEGGTSKGMPEESKENNKPGGEEAKEQPDAKRAKTGADDSKTKVA